MLQCFSNNKTGMDQFQDCCKDGWYSRVKDCLQQSKMKPKLFFTTIPSLFKMKTLFKLCFYTMLQLRCSVTQHLPNKVLPEKMIWFKFSYALSHLALLKRQKPIDFFGDWQVCGLQWIGIPIIDVPKLFYCHNTVHTPLQLA